MLGPSWRSKLSWQVFSLEHDDPKIFTVSQWQHDKSKPGIIYLIYRIVIALFLFVTWLLSVIDYKNSNLTAEFRAKYLIYLTNWGYTTCTLQALVCLVMVAGSVLSSKLKSHPTIEKKVLKLYKFYRLLNVIATPVAFAITSMYWSVIYDASTMTFDEMNFFVHGSNSIFMMIDLMVVAHPVIFMHFIYTSIFGITYATFTLIYYLCGGTSREGNVYIYTILNWDNPGTTVLTCLGVLVFLIALHCLTWALQKLRRISEKGEKSIVDDKTKETTKKKHQGYVNEGMANDVV
ncbi:unnamed protein product [Brassicogethes aeneus]|uniref:Protein rolling stone n=1 Tax=Brassicogethes aeneus TaxID=1431903 RepID=A0A9P0BII7_BRAAE|nr:unnamed protein product [Brassicogethes aeneus]